MPEVEQASSIQYGDTNHNTSAILQGGVGSPRSRKFIRIEEIENSFLINDDGYRNKRYAADTTEGVLDIVKKLLNG